MIKEMNNDDKARAEKLIIEAWDEANLNRYDSAIDKASEALELDPDDWYISTSIGLFLRDQGDYGASERFCGRAVELAPEMSRTWENLAITFFDQEKFNLAVLIFAKSLEIEERPSTYTMMASAKIALGDFEGAINDSKRALELDPEWDEAEALLTEARELLAAG